MADSANDRPNIVFILTDDQGPWAMGCAGNDEIRTPNLDRIAATGVRFANFFCVSPVCSPARASIVTGRIPSQHGVHDWIRARHLPPEATAFETDDVSYIDVLAENGYVCGLSGKWHLGDSCSPRPAFAHWFAHQKGGGRYYDAPMVRDGKPVDVPGYVTDVITDDALAFIDLCRDEPFYLSVHYTAPHTPWEHHPAEIVALYDDCSFTTCPQEPVHPWAGDLTTKCMGDRAMMQGYYAAITAMDRNVGRILDRLEALGLRENTLVVFTSDNGFSCGHHGFWGKGNATWPLNMYENSVKVPTLMSHPGRIEPGQVCDALLSHYDLFPTLLEYVGIDAPEDPTRPGVSFVPTLYGCEGGREEVVVFEEYGPVRMVRTREWKYIHRYPYGPHELYDLVNDPDERANLADDESQAGRVAEMCGRLSDWFARYVRPPMDGTRFPISGAGQADKIGRVGPGEACFYMDRPNQSPPWTVP